MVNLSCKHNFTAVKEQGWLQTTKFDHSDARHLLSLHADNVELSPCIKIGGIWF